LIYIFLAASCSISIVVIFKLFDRYSVNRYQAIVFNYLVCVITGCVNLGEIPFERSMFSESWFPIVIVLGLLFMGGFNLMGRTIQHFGVAITSVAQRMSLGLSASFAIIYYNEPYDILKIIGILLALSAVVFINIPNKKQSETKVDTATEDKKISKWLMLYPVSIFCVSASIEILMQYLHRVHQMQPAVESIVLFASAGIIGFIGLVFFREKIEFKNFIGGIVLGVPNYFAIYSLLNALEEMDGSVVYSLSNITIVTGAALVGYLIFKERLSTLNLLGILLSVTAIILIAISNMGTV
jgi:drug/metabolite transporter (DMT)-like permease